MSFTAHLYKFSKDNRSTGIPSGNGTTITGINYKKPTSRETPDFEFTTDSMSDDFEFNYLKIHDKYFYINDITVGNRDKFILHCSKDKLASHRTAILNSNQYVVRSTHTADKNGFINDTAYPMTTEVNKARNYPGDTSNWFGNMGTAVLAVLGPNAGDTTTYYEMPVLRLTTLIQTLYGIDVTQELSIASIELGLLKTLYDPIKYMTSCILLPYAFTGTGDTSVIHCGYVDLPLNDQVVRKLNSSDTKGFTANISYASHPQAYDRGAYLNSGPYTQRTLTVMPFGTFNIDCSKLNDYQNMLRLAVTMCKSDGNAVLEVYTISDSASGAHNSILWANAQLGVHIPLYQSDSIFKQTYSAMGAQVGAVSGVLSGNFASLPGSAMQWAGAINTMHAPEVKQIGGCSGTFLYTGSSAGTGAVDLPRLDSTYYNIVPHDNNLGSMVCAMKRLGDMPGFNICQNAKIDISGPESDREYIRNVMNTGIIIE